MKKINDESGQTLIMVALSLTVLLGFSALATDVGTLLHQRRIAQAAADSAAIAGATAALGVQNGSGAQAVATTAGQLDASNYGFSSSEVTINTPPTDDINSAFNNPGYVEAIVTETMPTPIISTFVHLVNPSSTYNGMTITARAVATDTITSNGCVYIPNPTNYNPAADLGGNSLLLTPNCTVNIDGNLTMSGSSDINAGLLNVSGGIDFIGNKAAVPPGTVPGVAPQSDPLGYLSQQSPSPYYPTIPSGTAQNSAFACPTGVAGTCYYDYQNGNLSGPLEPGLYYFDEDISITGTLTMASNAPARSGVTIFMSGTHLFSFKNNGTINLRAPQPQNPNATNCSGDPNPFCGVLVDAPTDVATDNSCTHGSNPNIVAGSIQLDFGSSVTSFEGAVYAPQAHLFLQDQGSTATINSDLDVGTLCQQSANVTIAGQSIDTPITKIGLVE